MIQIGEATKAVESIGLVATIAILLLLGGGSAAVLLFRYFSGRLDKKDTHIQGQQEAFSTQLLELTSQRRDDLDRFGDVLDSNLAGQREVVASQKEVVNSQKEVTTTLKELVKEVKRKGKE